MLKVSKSRREEEDYDDNEFLSENYASSQNVLVDVMRTGQHSCNRSKHSATEQRRRSKINERFQILRDIIPQNDQKRDKASLLLEVIKYVQFLQGKLTMYEGSYQEWNREPAKLTPWRNVHERLGTYTDDSQVIENGCGQENYIVSPTILRNLQDLVESNLTVGPSHGFVSHTHVQQTLTSSLNIPLLPNMFGSTHASQMLPDSASEHMNAHAQCHRSKTCVTATKCNVPHVQEFTTENKANSISNTYSRGVFHTLIQALQCAGVDTSQVAISVHIDVAKQANSDIQEDDRLLSRVNRGVAPSVVERYGVNGACPYKRIRTEKL